MKRVLLAMLSIGLLSSPYLFAAAAGNAPAPSNNYSVQSLDANGNGMYEAGEIDPCAEYSCGPCKCYCPVTRFRPQYYQTCRCVQEPYNVYQQCCQYVPQYYSVTYCRQVPQYYYTCQTCYKNRYCYDQHCHYVPYCYVKECCVDNACGAPASAPACSGGGCSSRR